MARSLLERKRASRDPEPGSAPSHSEDGGFLSPTVRAHIVAMSGEFVGTTMFLFFAFGGTQIANTLTPSTEPNLTQLMFISLSFGFSLAVTAWVFYRISGGLFNPAVSNCLLQALGTSWDILCGIA